MPGAVIALVLVRWMLRRDRQLAALLGVEVLLASVVSYITVSDRLFGGLTAYAALPAGVTPTGASNLGDYLDRGDRLVSLWIDRDVGLLRWAPFFALAFLAVWLLWRARRERLSRAIPELVDIQVAAKLLVAVAGAQVLVAVFLSPTMFGDAPPGRELVAALPIAAALCAWGLRHAPRVGAVLAAVTLAGSVWLYLWLRLADGHWVGPTTPAPWGPLERLFPPYASGATWADAVTLAAAAVLAALVAVEWRRWRGPRLA